jgi:hypothetical protein
MNGLWILEKINKHFEGVRGEFDTMGSKKKISVLVSLLMIMIMMVS